MDKKETIYSPSQKKAQILYSILAVVIIVAVIYFGYIYFKNRSKNSIPTTQTSVDDITAIDNDLKDIDGAFDQLNNIDINMDQAPSL